MKRLFLIIIITGLLLLFNTGCGKSDKYVPNISSSECSSVIKWSVLNGEFNERQELLASSGTVFLDGYEYRMTDFCAHMIRTYGAATNGNPIP